jgi:hypothetical protein
MAIQAHQPGGSCGDVLVTVVICYRCGYGDMLSGSSVVISRGNGHGNVTMATLWWYNY